MVVLVSAPAHAQMTDTPAPLTPGLSDALIRLGPLAMQPRVRLSNLGIDTNVYNSAAAPTRDVTATLVPSLESVLRAGRTLTTSRTSGEFVYFQKANAQRSLAFSQEGRFDVLLARLTPFLTAAHLNTHQRPNLEIDERIEQTRTGVGGGLGLRLSARTNVTVSHDRQRVQYGSTESAVASLLNRRAALTTAALHLELTPLTTLVVRAEAEQDRFERSSLRDSDSVAALAGFDLKPFALISGTAMAGYRRISARNPLMPDFGGLVASVNVSYVMRGTMLVGLTAGRGVEYSIESQEPYYISAGGTVTVRQALGRRWDVVGRFGRNTMAYRGLELPEGLPSVESRRDRHTLYGTGMGLHVGTAMRIGVDVTYEERRSPVAARQYEGYRAGGTVTYGY